LPVQIAEAFRRFGVSDHSKNILAIKVDGDPVHVESHLRQHVEGERVPFSDETLATMYDPARLRKIYRVDLKSADAGWFERSEAFILGTMALKGT